MRESTVESYLVKRCKELGIYERKFVSPQRRNVPDRILVYNGVVVFVELKKPGEKPTPAQKREHIRLTEAGALVVVVDSKAEADWLLQECFR